MATPPDAGFRRELGLLDAVVVVAGGIIGVGIFANPSNVARVLQSPLLILLAWSLGGGVALLGGFIWAELGSRLPHVGGQYVYLARALPADRRLPLRRGAAVHHQRRRRSRPWRSCSPPTWIARSCRWARRASGRLRPRR